MIVVTLLSCRELIFPTCQLWVRVLRVLLWQHRVCMHACVCACVSICLKCVCVLLCVCLCSLCLISVKKLGHDVCKGACSNYGQLCSLNTRPHCTLLLTPTWHLHHPPIHSQPRSILRWSANMLCTQPPGVYCVHCDLGGYQTQILSALCVFLCSPSILLVSGGNSLKDLVWKRFNESWKTLKSSMLSSDSWL